MIETYIRKIIETPEEEFTKVTKRRYGFELNGWYNIAYGRTIMYGDVTYEAEKNFRCVENFEKYKNTNVMRKKTFIVLIQVTPENNIISTLNEIHTMDEFMSCQTFPEDIDLFMVGFINNKYKQKSNKRFYINTEEMVVVDLKSGQNIFIEKRVTFDCIFLDEPTQKDSMLT